LAQTRLKLAVSKEIVGEYLSVFDEVLGLEANTLKSWRMRFGNRTITETVRPGSIRQVSRDPKDDAFVAVASAAKVKFLITNDRDLLELPPNAKKRLKTRILSPTDFPC
jgi:putative PIN family toxin of toxin-antitoxin system